METKRITQTGDRYRNLQFFKKNSHNFLGKGRFGNIWGGGGNKSLDEQGAKLYCFGFFDTELGESEAAAAREKSWSEYEAFKS